MVTNSLSRIRVVIAERAPVYREGLRLLLERAGLEVVGAAGDVRQALALTRELAPDVLVLDLSIPGVDVDRMMRALSALPKSPRILLLADETWLDRAMRAIMNGAHGFFSKDDDAELLPKGIRCLSSGEYWVGRESMASVVDLARQEMAQRGKPRRGVFGLTQRKLEIISGIADGQSNREIAAALGLSEQTVKHHLSSIFEKTGVSSRLELALFSITHHLNDRPPTIRSPRVGRRDVQRDVSSRQ